MDGKDDGSAKKGGNAWWTERSLGGKILIGAGLGLLGLGLLALFGLAVMALWNWLMPELFGLKRVSYWQAWGLLALSTLLFKNLGSGEDGKRSDRKRKRELRRHLEEECPPGPEEAKSAAQA